jgi:hypothetical protein
MGELSCIVLKPVLPEPFFFSTVNLFLTPRNMYLSGFL